MRIHEKTWENPRKHEKLEITRHEVTFRWSNCECWDPKVGGFLKSTQATSCGHFLNWKLTPENPLWTPCPWPPWPWFSCEKSLKIFEDLWKTRNFERHFKNLDLAGKWVQRAQICLVCKLVFRATHSVLHYFWSVQWLQSGAQRSHERAPQNVQMTLKDQSFVSKLKLLFVRLPEDVWPSNFGKCLKMPQR